MKKILVTILGFSLFSCAGSDPKRISGGNNATPGSTVSTFTLSIPANPAAAADDKISYAINVSKAQGNLGVKVQCVKDGVKDPVTKTSTIEDDVLEKSIETILAGKAVIKSEPAKFAGIRGHVPNVIQYELTKPDKTKQNVKVSDPVIYEGTNESIAIVKLTALAYEICHAN